MRRAKEKLIWVVLIATVCGVFYLMSLSVWTDENNDAWDTVSPPVRSPFGRSDRGKPNTTRPDSAPETSGRFAAP
jgi:hypothetical protein